MYFQHVKKTKFDFQYNTKTLIAKTPLGLMKTVMEFMAIARTFNDEVKRKLVFYAHVDLRAFR